MRVENCSAQSHLNPSLTHKTSTLAFGYHCAERAQCLSWRVRVISGSDGRGVATNTYVNASLSANAIGTRSQDLPAQARNPSYPTKDGASMIVKCRVFVSKYKTNVKSQFYMHRRSIFTQMRSQDVRVPSTFCRIWNRPCVILKPDLSRAQVRGNSCPETAKATPLAPPQ